MTLYYVPLEPYPERYTMQLSAPVAGWFEREWIKAEIQYIRIEGEHRQGHIGSGVVLDAVGRSTHCFSQITKLLHRAESGELTREDVVYFDDFWHPGTEALQYTFDVLGKKPPRMFAYCWAQSVDVYDFTHKMKYWIRHFEMGIADILWRSGGGLFVASTMLKDLLVRYAIMHPGCIHVVGLPFCSEEALERMPKRYKLATETEEGERMYGYDRTTSIIWTSRWDSEKDPRFFMAVADIILAQDPKAKVVVCSSAQTLRSNDPALIEEARAIQAKFSNRFIVKVGLTKEEYYAELCQAKVQFNSSLQDWVSFTLLEAVVAGCFPIYPNHRSFPETFRNQELYMYEAGNVVNAATKVCYILGLTSPWKRDSIERRKWIYNRYDTTWKRILLHMGLLKDDGGVEFGNPYEQEEV